MAACALLVGCGEKRISSYEGQFEDQIKFTYPTEPPEQEFPVHVGLVDQFMREKRIGYYSGGGGSGAIVTSTKVRIDMSKVNPEELKQTLISERILPPDTVIEIED